MPGAIPSFGLRGASSRLPIQLPTAARPCRRTLAELLSARHDALMASMGRTKWAVIGLVIGVGASGVGFAVATTSPPSSDRYYACTTSTGAVRPETIAANKAPAKCKSSTDVVRSWNAAGVTGATGAVGSTGATGATGATGVVDAASFRASKPADQAYAAGPLFNPGPYPAVFLKVIYDAEDHDDDGAYDPATSVFTAPAAGAYMFGASLITYTPSQAYTELVIAVNGEMYARIDAKNQGGGTYQTMNGTSLQRLAAGDKVEIWFYSTVAGSVIISDTPDYGYRNNSFFGYRVSA